jgi:hypothetical protein
VGGNAQRLDPVGRHAAQPIERGLQHRLPRRIAGRNVKNNRIRGARGRDETRSIGAGQLAQTHRPDRQHGPQPLFEHLLERGSHPSPADRRRESDNDLRQLAVASRGRRGAGVKGRDRLRAVVVLRHGDELRRCSHVFQNRCHM